MKTYKGAGIVWRDNKMVARFVGGTFSTDDAATIAVLDEMGYLCVAETLDETKAAAPQKAAKPPVDKV